MIGPGRQRHLAWAALLPGRAEVHVAARQARSGGVLLLGALAAQLVPLAFGWIDAGGVAPPLGALLALAWLPAVAVAMPCALVLHAVACDARGERLAWSSALGRAPRRAALCAAVVWLPVVVSVGRVVDCLEPLARDRVQGEARRALGARPELLVGLVGDNGVAIGAVEGATRVLAPLGDDALALRVAALRPGAGPELELALASGEAALLSADGSCDVLGAFGGVRVAVPLEARSLADMSERELATATLAAGEPRWRRARQQRGPFDAAAAVARERARRAAAPWAAWLALGWAASTWAARGRLRTLPAIAWRALPAMVILLFGPRLWGLSCG
ncbi:MAG: hypothetical protein IPM29_12740 [Planctomycetes bacterium]|nr:hypothetical protein [Planctomycetota bacterium]